jgi:ribosomal-protein-alanine N-acetyltransferase
VKLAFAPFAEAHLEPVLAIERASNGAPWSEASFRAEIANPHGRMLVALEGGQVVGFGGVWMVVDEAHITNLAVHPERRRRGIGRDLVVALLREAQSMGMRCATLEVRAGNVAAITLYEALGFRSIATRKRYYPDNQEDAVVMWLADLQGWTP